MSFRSQSLELSKPTMHSELALCLTAEQRGIHDQEKFLKAILLPNYPCTVSDNEYDISCKL